MISIASAARYADINYNDYYYSGSNLGYIGGADRANLAAWAAATGKDANSWLVDPLFVSATDLHLQGTSVLIDVGTDIAAVTDDIDGGDARPAGSYDIGADEVNSCPAVITQSVSQVITPLNSIACKMGWNHCRKQLLQGVQLLFSGFRRLRPYYVASVDIGVENANAGGSIPDPAKADVLRIFGGYPQDG